MKSGIRNYFYFVGSDGDSFISENFWKNIRKVEIIKVKRSGIL